MALPSADRVREFFRFGLVGLLGAVVDIGLFNLLHHVWGTGPLTSKAVSTFAAAVVTYIGNRVWTFRHCTPAGVLRDFPVFVLLNVIGLGIAELVLSFTYYALDLRGPIATNLSANVFGIGLGTLFRLWAYKRWIFREPPVSEAVSGQIDLTDELVAVLQV